MLLTVFKAFGNVIEMFGNVCYNPSLLLASAKWSHLDRLLFLRLARS